LSRGFNDERRTRALNRLTSTQAPLVLDDLDKAKPTVFAAEQIFCAIDGAIVNKRPLIVTANVMPSALAAKWPAPHGEAIASRLAGYCRVCMVKGDDRRIARAA
jgi:DNA replication protein DnaC